MKIYEEYLEQAKLVHQEGNYWQGNTVKRYISDIDKLIQSKNYNTILDYGCGQAMHQPEYWNVTNYDPAVERFNIKPTGEFDLVICVDVLEHIPQEGLEMVLDDIFSFNQKHTFLTVHSGIALKALPNGKNAHATVMPHRWWHNLLSKYDNYTLLFTK